MNLCMRGGIAKLGRMDDYPHLAQGSNRLLLLDSHDGRFEWSSLLKKDQKKPLRLSHSAAIFPPTRPPQDLDHSTTILKNAEQGVSMSHIHLLQPLNSP